MAVSSGSTPPERRAWAVSVSPVATTLLPFGFSISSRARRSEPLGVMGPMVNETSFAPADATMRRNLPFAEPSSGMATDGDVPSDAPVVAVGESTSIHA